MDNLTKTALALSVIGLIIGIYLTVTHYLNVPVACPNIGIIDCGAVLNSQYSVILGIPLALLAAIYFAIMIPLIMKNKEYALYWNVLGVIFLIYPLYAEFQLGKICLYCTTLHIIVIATLIVLIFERRSG